MILKYLKEWFSVDIPADKRRDFDYEIARTNVFRAKLTSAAFFFIELFVIMIFCFTRYENLFIYPNSAYLLMYLLLLTSMPVFFFAFRHFENDVGRNVRKNLITGIIFSYFLLLWCAAISLIDQLSSGQVLVYISAIMAIALAPLFKPLVLLGIYMSAQIPFMIALPYFHKSQSHQFGIFINTSTIIFISWVISRMLYKSKCNDFLNRLIIQEKNIELSIMNEKLMESNRELEKLSNIDSLTGLYNRRKFDEILEIEWRTCKRYSVPISLIMIDIDYFKQFNDIHGHQAGDNCLRQVAGALLNTARRSSDIVARYGGEEFIIAMPHMDSQMAYTAAEKIRNSVEALKIYHGDSTVSDFITISTGICTAVPSNNLSISDVINTADKALYKAKTNRRNTIEVLEI